MPPEIRATFRPVADLKPYKRNARVRTPEDVEAIAASIREFGFTNPVLADGDGIVAGHGRVAAAKLVYDAGGSIRLPSGAACPPGTVPVLDCSGWSKAQRRAYIIADNQIAARSSWDDALLRLELGELKIDGFNLPVIGFDTKALAGLLTPKSEGQSDPDVVPEPPAVPCAQAGDVWVLGAHRLACGDSTASATVAALLGQEKPVVMVTDPPYGVEYDPSWRNRAGTNSNLKKQGKVLNDDRADWSEAWALFPGDVAYVWHGGLHAGTVADSLTSQGFLIRAQIIWAKDRFALSRGDYHWQHEPAWYVVRKGRPGGWAGDRSQSTLWMIPARDDSGHGHGTQKPVECMRRPILNSSREGDAVYEPFSGSGTTIIACEMTARRCFAVELNPVYVDVAVERWQQFSGHTATLAGDGRTFAEIKAARLAPAKTKRRPKSGTQTAADRETGHGQ